MHLDTELPIFGNTRSLYCEATCHRFELQNTVMFMLPDWVMQVSLNWVIYVIYVT
jgi:hypothetical protein